MNEIKKIDIVNFKKEPYIKFEEKIYENPNIIQEIQNIETMNFEKEKNEKIKSLIPKTKKIESINYSKGNYKIITKTNKILLYEKQNDNTYTVYEIKNNDQTKIGTIKKEEIRTTIAKYNRKMMKNNISIILGIEKDKVNLNDPTLIELATAKLAIMLATDENTIITNSDEDKIKIENYLKKYIKLYKKTIEQYPADDEQGNNRAPFACTIASSAFIRATSDPDMKANSPEYMQEYLDKSNKWIKVKNEDGKTLELSQNDNFKELEEKGLIKPGDLIISPRMHIIIYTGSASTDGTNIVEAFYGDGIRGKGKYPRRTYHEHPENYHDLEDIYKVYRPNTEKIGESIYETPYPMINIKEIIE